MRECFLLLMAVALLLPTHIKSLQYPPPPPPPIFLRTRLPLILQLPLL